MKPDNYDSREFVNILKNKYNTEYQIFKNNLHVSLTQLGIQTNTYDFNKLIIAVKNIKNIGPLIFVFLSICNYFLSKYDEVDKFIAELKKNYPGFGEEDLLIALNEILSIRADNTVLFNYSINFSFTYAKSELINYEEVYYKIVSNWDNQKIKHDIINSVEHLDKGLYLDNLIKSNPVIHIFGGHGDSNLGLALFLLKARKALRLEAAEMKNIMQNMHEDNNTGILLLGCNPDIYIKNISGPIVCKYLIYSDSTTDLNIYPFLSAFFSVFNFTYDYLMAYKAGRLSLSIKGISDEDFMLKVYDNSTNSWISYN